MNTTEDERQKYLLVANDLEAISFPGSRQDADFLRRVIGDVGWLERELRFVLPLYNSKGCWNCHCKHFRTSDKVHVINVYAKECLYHSKYAGARAVLGIPDEPAACVTCGKPDTM